MSQTPLASDEEAVFVENIEPGDRIVSNPDGVNPTRNYARIDDICRNSFGTYSLLVREHGGKVERWTCHSTAWLRRVISPKTVSEEV